MGSWTRTRTTVPATEGSSNSELDRLGGDLVHQLCALFNRERTIATVGNLYALCYHCVALGTGVMGDMSLLLFIFDLLLICYKYMMLE